jgi:hypothetical protein
LDSSLLANLKTKISNLNFFLIDHSSWKVNMCPYTRYKPISAKFSPSQVLENHNAILKDYQAKKQKFLKDCSPIKCLPSFLTRTLQDYVSNAKEISQYEQMVINAWENAGLDQGKAKAVLERLYTIPDFYAHLDLKVLSRAHKLLDKGLVKDLAGVKWSAFLEKRIDPNRLKNALKAGSDAGLSEREKDFIRAHSATYEPEAKEANIAKVGEMTGFLFSKTSGKYVVCEAYKPAKVFEDLASLAKYAEAAASQPPPPPEKKVCAYNWRVSQLGHKIEGYSELTGDDPVFIVNLFKYSDFSPRMENLLEEPHIYKPKDDEKHSHFRPEFCELYRTYNDFLGTERPVLVVTAFENDQWFSDDTKMYAKFGLELASRVASLDPTGFTSLGVAIITLAWSIVCFLDWLDDDDYIDTTTYQFFPSWIPEGTDSSHPYTKEVDITLRKGYSIWKYRIQIVSRGVVYITQ